MISGVFVLEGISFSLINNSRKALLKVFGVEVVNAWTTVRTFFVFIIDFGQLGFTKFHVFETLLNFFKVEQIRPLCLLSFRLLLGVDINH